MLGLHKKFLLSQISRACNALAGSLRFLFCPIGTSFAAAGTFIYFNRIARSTRCLQI